MINVCVCVCVLLRAWPIREHRELGQSGTSGCLANQSARWVSLAVPLNELVAVTTSNRVLTGMQIAILIVLTDGLDW